jgi:hypothetical protein
MAQFSSFIHDNLTTNVIQIFMCYAFGFLCLIPLYYEPISYLEESKIRDALRSKKFHSSSVATLALVIPIIFDMVHMYIHVYIYACI